MRFFSRTTFHPHNGSLFGTTLFETRGLATGVAEIESGKCTEHGEGGVLRAMLHE
jgi:hypothetical protein